MTLPLLASAEDVVIAWLLGLTVATDAMGQRIRTRLIDSETYPKARVTRVGGTVNEDPWYDNPRVQVELWGSSPQDTVTIADEDVDLLARQIAAAVINLRGPVGDGFVSYAYVSVGPLPLPDPTSNRYRQLIEITLEVDPA